MTHLQTAALEMLRCPITTLHVSHVCAFDFLAKYLRFAPALFTEVQGFAVLNVILRLTAQFPDATNLVGSMFRFLRAGLLAAHLRMDIVAIFVPILIVNAESASRTAVVASSRLFLADLEASRGGNAEVDQMLRASTDFREFRAQRLLQYTASLEAAYGGPITKYVKKTRSINRLID
jgi:hypothetical protein